MNYKKLNIFLADDDEDDRGFFQDALSEINKNCNLIMVDSGEKLINYFKANNPLPDLIFLDINMPIKNGLECLKFLKETQPPDKFHVVMLSTSITPKDIETSYKLGASVYIQKPGSFSELVSYLDYCVNELCNLHDRPDFVLNHKLSKKSN